MQTPAFLAVPTPAFLAVKTPGCKYLKQSVIRYDPKQKAENSLRNLRR